MFILQKGLIHNSNCKSKNGWKDSWQQNKANSESDKNWTKL